MKNYYQFLGLERSASSSEIKKAYKDYAKRFHPDKHGDDAFFKERFQEIQAANYTLSDPVRRSEYDKLFFKQDDPIKTAPVNEDSAKTNSSSYSQKNSNQQEPPNNAQTERDNTQQESNSSQVSGNPNQGHWSDIWGYPLFFAIGAIVTALLFDTIGKLILGNLFSDESSYNSFHYGSIFVGGVTLMIWYHFQD